MEKKVRVGVIGAGWRSQILQFLKDDEQVELVAVADLSLERLSEFAKETNDNIFQTTDYHQLLARSDVDAVFIMTPDYLHEEQALAALDAGKYVYLEKPMAVTIEGCDRVLSASRDHGNKLMVGFNLRYTAMFQKMKQMIERGDIGEIKAVWVRHFVGRGGDYYFHDWHAKRNHTTSLLLQKASHDLDVIHWLTGQYTTRVAGFGGLDYFGGDKPNDLHCPECKLRHDCWEYNESPRTLCAFREEVDVEDNQVIVLELSGGIKASYSQCHFTPDYHRNFVIIGTEGRLENSEPDSTILVTHRRNVPGTGLTDEVITIHSETEHSQADKRILREFVQMVQTGGRPPVDPLDGRMSVAVGVRAAESIRAGGEVMAIPPIKLESHQTKGA